MTQIVKLQCPSCSSMLKIPTDWLELTMRCKHCGHLLRSRKKSQPDTTTSALPANKLDFAVPGAIAALPTAAAGLVAPGTAAPIQPRTGYPVPEAAPVPVGYVPPVPQPTPGYPQPVPAPPVHFAPMGSPGFPVAPTAYAGSPAQFNAPALPGPSLPGQMPPGPSLPGQMPPGPSLPGQALPSSTRIITTPRNTQRSQLPKVVGVLALMGVLAVGLLVGPGLFRSKPKGEQAKTTESSKVVTPVSTTSSMPRRMLAITVSNYIYANPINYGNEQRGVRSLINVLRRGWRVPDDQVYELSDNAPDGKAKPTLKRSIEKAVDDFLSTSRSQDRIAVLIVGHIIERDGTAYLVPLEGNLEDTASLVKFSGDDSILSKLAACKAQQKLLIVDTCRYDPGRGEERPGSGPMSEELDKILSEPPPGVQILSSCSKGEYSYEFDNGLNYNNRPIQGSAFVNLFVNSSTQVTLGIQTPKSALPIEPYMKKLTEIFRSPDPKTQLKQTPRLVGIGPPKEGLYDEKEPPAARVVLGDPSNGLSGGSAPSEEIRRLLDEIDVPPIKLARRDSLPLRLESIIPFSAEKMKEYAADYRTREDLEKSAEKFPLRRAVLDAKKVFDQIRKSMDKGELPESFVGEATDAVKKDIADKQRTPAELLVKLETLLDELNETAEKEMENEPSKRWRAHFDYIRAQVMARYMYTSEYNYMLAGIRTDRLPDLDEKAGHKGWRLSARSEFSNRDAKKLKNEWMELLDKIIEENPGTPWEVLARRDRTMALGLAWEPTANILD